MSKPVRPNKFKNELQSYIQNPRIRQNRLNLIINTSKPNDNRHIHIISIWYQILPVCGTVAVTVAVFLIWFCVIGTYPLKIYLTEIDIHRKIHSKIM